MKLSLNELLNIIKEAAEEKKAFDINIIEVKSVTVLTNYFLVCSSDSNVQSRAIADNIIEKLEEKGLRITSREGYQKGDWVVIDARSIIVHVFTPEIREYYNLENFWMQEIERVQKDSSNNLSGLIKTRKSKPESKTIKSSKPAVALKGRTVAGKKAAEPGGRGDKTAGKNEFKPAGTALKAKKEAAKRTLSKKEQIEKELLKKSKPTAKNILSKTKPAEKSRKQLIEEEIMRLKQKKEENFAKQTSNKKSAVPRASETAPGAKNAAKKLRDAAAFASKAMSKAGSMSAMKCKKGAKK